jgi:hypothetical protein
MPVRKRSGEVLGMGSAGAEDSGFVNPGTLLCHGP